MHDQLGWMVPRGVRWSSVHGDCRHVHGHCKAHDGDEHDGQSSFIDLIGYFHLYRSTLTLRLLECQHKRRGWLETIGAGNNGPPAQATSFCCSLGELVDYETGLVFRWTERGSCVDL